MEVSARVVCASLLVWVWMVWIVWMVSLRRMGKERMVEERETEMGDEVWAVERVFDEASEGAGDEAGVAV